VQRLAVRAIQVEVAKPKSMVIPRRFSSSSRVGVDPGQRLHQGRLPVIDMAGRAYDDRFHLKFLAISCQLSALSY
jgi:hypothetical protein